MTSKGEAPAPCPRCGQVDCDTVDPAIWPKLMALLAQLPKDETPEEDDDLPDPFV